MEEAGKLLESLEAQQAAEVNTPPPRDQEHEGEHDEEPPSKRLKLRKKSKQTVSNERLMMTGPGRRKLPLRSDDPRVS